MELDNLGILLDIFTSSKGVPMDLLWGIWNGITAWGLLGLHVVGVLEEYPVYNICRNGSVYLGGFMLGVSTQLYALYYIVFSD